MVRFIFIALIALQLSLALGGECKKNVPKYEKLKCEANLKKYGSSSELVCKSLDAGTMSSLVKNSAGDNFDLNSIDSVSDRGGGLFFTRFLDQNCQTPNAAEIQKYGEALLMLAVPAVFFMALNLNCCICCTCCHTCCKLCSCGHTFKCIPSSEHGYTKCAKTSPIIVWGIFSALLFAFAAVGIVMGVYAFNDSVVGGVCQIDNTYVRFSTFLKGIKAPMTKLKSDFALAVVDLKDASQIDPSLAQNVANIATNFGNIKTAAENCQSAASAITGCNTAWNKVVDSVESARSSSVTTAETLKTTLETLQKSIDSGIVGAASGADGAITTGENAITDLQKQLDALMNPKKLMGINLITYAEEVRNQRDNVAFGAFGWVYIAVFFSFIGIVGMIFFREDYFIEQGNGRKSNRKLQGPVIQLTLLGRCCSRFSCCSWWLMLFFGIFSALFATIWTSVAAGGRDMCSVLPTIPSDIGGYINQPKVTDITNTCWNTTGNLFEGLGIDKSIDVNAINFDDFDTQFAAPEIPTEGLNTLLKVINNDVPANCKPNANLITTLKAKITDTNSSIIFAENAFAGSSIVADIKKSGSSLVETIKSAIVSFKDATGCYFIACTWQETVGVICDGMIASLGWLGLAQMFIAGLAVPFAITVMVVMQRFGGHGAVKSELGGGVEMTPKDNQKNPYVVDGDADGYN